jgi:hypothetical protein
MKRKSITVTVTKTVQAAAFEPVVISVAETAELEDGDKASSVKAKLYASASASVHEYMKEELTLWRRKAKKD